jgi:hypothetical protein
MLQVFHLDVAKVNLDVAYVCNDYTCVSSVCKCFSCFELMLQVFHLDVAKIHLVLYMMQWYPPAAVTCYSCWGAAVGHIASA